MRGQREYLFFEKNGRGEDEKSDRSLRMPMYHPDLTYPL